MFIKLNINNIFLYSFKFIIYFIIYQLEKNIIIQCFNPSS